MRITGELLLPWLRDSNDKQISVSTYQRPFIRSELNMMILALLNNCYQLTASELGKRATVPLAPHRVSILYMALAGMRLGTILSVGERQCTAVKTMAIRKHLRFRGQQLPNECVSLRPSSKPHCLPSHILSKQRSPSGSVVANERLVQSSTPLGQDSGTLHKNISPQSPKSVVENTVYKLTQLPRAVSGSWLKSTGRGIAPN